MRSRMNVFAALSLLIIAAMAFSACTAVAPSAPGGEAAEETIELEVWRGAGSATPPGRGAYWWDDDGEILEMWAEEHPNIEIKIENIPFEQFDTKELTALQGGGAPDLMFVNHVTVGSAFGTGGLEPLEWCIESHESLDPSDWIPGMWSVGTRDGNQVTIPWDTDTRILWYNKALLEEAGITEPPQTWDELYQAIDAIAALEKDGVSPWGYFGGSHWGVLYQDIGPWLVQMNTSFLTEDGNASAALEPATVEAFTHAVKLAQSTSEGAINYTSGDLENLFAQGKLAFFVWGMWYAPVIEALSPDWELGVDYDIALLPGPEAGQTGSSNGGWQLAISKESEHKDEACQFLAFVTQPDIMALGTKAHIPTRLSSQETEYFTGDPFIEKSLEQAAYGRPPVTTVPELPEIAQLVQRQFIRAVTGEVTADEALAEIDQQITELLAKR